MTLGLAQGNDDPQGKENTYQIAQVFISKFKACHGAILCHDLIGYDISTPAGLKAARDGKLFDSVCPVLVRETAKLLSDLSVK
jgi:hypothetical protein